MSKLEAANQHTSIESIVLFPMNYILKLVNLCILAFDFEKITIGGFVLGGFTLFYYLCLILPSDKLNFKKLTKSVACVISAIIVLVGSVCLTSYENNQSKVLVMGSENLCATVVECKDENTIDGLERWKYLTVLGGGDITRTLFLRAVWMAISP